jgi:hypothetical protein
MGVNVYQLEGQAIHWLMPLKGGILEMDYYFLFEECPLIQALPYT